MQAFYSDHFVLPLPPGHRFPMAKYAMLREAIAQHLPAVTARLAQAEWQRQHRQPLKVAVIDLDVHQGNGTAHIFQQDDSVFTLSLHGDKNFPFRKEASDLDVALPDGCNDADYLAALEQALLELSQRFEPGLVLYLAGADPYRGDRLGRLALTEDGLEARDRCVFDWCHERRIPVAFVMAGGYGRQIEETVRIQRRTFRLGLSYAQRWQQHPGQQAGLDV
jgi:acetoin utilization deacetylase AcuC-like enzyme